MDLTSDLPDDRRRHVEQRLRTNQIAWLTTVRSGERPLTVPVWFLLRDDGTLVVYSQPNRAKLRNIAERPVVTLALDATDIGRDVIWIEATAEHRPDLPAADALPGYASKYAERIATMFGTAADFAAAFSAPLVLTPTRLHAD